MYNTSRLVVFLRGLGEGVEGGLLKEWEAPSLRFPSHVVNKIGQGVPYGSEGCCSEKYPNKTSF